MSDDGYIGRFAPSPTGPLHAGSLVAALASWLDAKAHGGQWLVRMEDVDLPRCVPGADRTILQQLAACGLQPDQPPVWQSQRSALYQTALDALVAQGHSYPCACSRKDIEAALAQQGKAKPRNGELIYPGTCRTGLHTGLAHASHASHVHCAWRLRTDGTALVQWTDRQLGPQQQAVEEKVGDFVLRRADGCYAYQLAVVVDDAAQGVTHIVRGQDLADNTARQIMLQRTLQLPTPQYLHTPLVLGANGEKLSKQNGAASLNTSTSSAALGALRQAAGVLGLDPGAVNDPPTTRDNRGQALAQWVNHWRAKYGP